MTYQYQFYFGYIVIAAFVLILVAAAWVDAVNFSIPNSLSIALFLLFAIAVAPMPNETDWWSHLGAGIAVFVAGALTYRFGVFGAGDVKLMTAVSLWAGLENLPFLMLYISLAGAGLALMLIQLRRVILAIAIRRSNFDSDTLPRCLIAGKKVPYGVAIAFGSISLVDKFPHLAVYL